MTSVNFSLNLLTMLKKMLWKINKLKKTHSKTCPMLRTMLWNKLKKTHSKAFHMLRKINKLKKTHSKTCNGTNSLKQPPISIQYLILRKHGTRTRISMFNLCQTTSLRRNLRNNLIFVKLLTAKSWRREL